MLQFAAGRPFKIPDTFRPPRSGPLALPHNLPADVTPLIGRERELAQTGAVLRQSPVRLLTLTGPGGVGKTRLAFGLAAEWLDDSRALDDVADGIFWVSLAAIDDPALVVAAIAQALEVREAGGQSLLPSLKAYLRDKQMLLLLDNFEHLMNAAPQVSELLAACPALKLLITSREVLRLSGEYEYPVPPLALPDLNRLSSPEALAEVDSVTLFTQRAGAVCPNFAVSVDNVRAIAEICLHLDGLPLAIELAAARIRSLSPQGILERLAGQEGQMALQLLTHGPRDLPARQRTLRSTIDWSYHLLSEDEKTLFQRLAVFAGGFTLGAAEEVIGDSHSSISDLQSPISVLDGLESLLEKSLLRRLGEENGEPCYGMLQTIREYGLEQLAASREADLMRWYHAHYYLTLAERAEPKLTGPERESWLARLDTEHDNLRAALGWSLGKDEGRAPFPRRGSRSGSGTRGARMKDESFGVRLAGALWWFWRLRGHLSEGRSWLEATLGLAPPNPSSSTQHSALSTQHFCWRAKALLAAGALASVQGDYATARSRLSESAECWREMQDDRGLACALTILGLVALYQQSLDEAGELQQQSVTLLRPTGDRWWLAFALDGLGYALAAQKQYNAARIALEESLALFRQVGDPWGLSLALGTLGGVISELGDLVTARAHLEECLGIARAMNDKWLVVQLLGSLGEVSWAQGDTQQAVTRFEHSLALYRELGNRRGIAGESTSLGLLAQLQGQYDQAAIRFQESLALYQELGEPRDQACAAQVLDYWGEVARAQNDLPQALVHFQDSLAVVRGLNQTRAIAMASYKVGELALRQGNYAEATAHLEESLRLAWDESQEGLVAICLARLAESAAMQDHPEQAARLWGAAESRLPEPAAWPSPIDQATLERTLLEHCALLGEKAFTTARARGRALTLEQAVALALGQKPAVHKKSYPFGLTEAEVQLLRLLPRGLTEKQLAAELDKSPRTINVQLQSIYSKLDVTSKTAAARIAIEQGLV